MHHRTFGSGPPVVALHGFTHDGSTWAGLAARMPERRIVAPDLRGHGRTGGSGDLDDAAADVVALVEHLGGACDVVGYSLGGRVALHAALAAPEQIRTLVLVGADPGIRDPRDRSERALADDHRARSLLADGLDVFVDAWEARPMFAGLAGRPDAERAELDRVRRSHDAGALAGVLSRMSPGRQRDLWPALESLPMPVLAVAGALDRKYAQIADAIAACVPRGESALVPGCGHAVHLEAPDAFAALLLGWLSTHSG